MNINNEKKVLKFFVTHAVYDKPARAAVLNIKCSHGYFGCLKCFQKGKIIKSLKGISFYFNIYSCIQYF